MSPAGEWFLGLGTIGRFIIALIVAIVISWFINEEVGHAAPPHASRVRSCDRLDAAQWTVREVKCVIRRTWSRENPLDAEDAKQIARCESNYDPYNTTPPYPARGLYQFLDDTWSRTPYRRRNVYDPVWNARAAWWLWRHDDRSWREWACADILGIN